MKSRSENYEEMLEARGWAIEKEEIREQSSEETIAHVVKITRKEDVRTVRGGTLLEALKAALAESSSRG